MVDILEALAEAAMVAHDRAVSIYRCDGKTPEWEKANNGAMLTLGCFRVACTPDVILALLSEVEQMKTERDALKERAQVAVDAMTPLVALLNEMRCATLPSTEAIP